MHTNLNFCILHRLLNLRNTMSMNLTTVRCIKMAYNEYKDKDTTDKKIPVIIMHCIMGSKHNWHDFAKELTGATNRTVYCVDARNHGQSEFTKEHSSQHLANDVQEFATDKYLNKVAVLGHGMGGRAMMFFALKYPNMVDRAIIADISPVALPRDYNFLEQIFLIMKGLEISSKHSLEDGRFMVAEIFSKIVQLEENAQFLASNLNKNEQGEFYWSINIEVLSKNLRTFSEFMSHLGLVEPFAGPVMFVSGKNSNFVHEDTIPSINQLFPNAEIHCLNAGHLVRMDQPKQFMELVIQFLNKE